KPCSKPWLGSDARASHPDGCSAESQTIKPVCAEAPTDREFRVPQTGIRKVHKGSGRIFDGSIRYDVTPRRAKMVDPVDLIHQPFKLDFALMSSTWTTKASESKFTLIRFLIE
ncbi:hypothetical protein, partial [Hydrogenibacillus schlegelii]|uniref:hypothetical protein n=1 Tax=Hydrogenibacillus schlegelii TaxID=1484 RepID=UPI0039E81B0D